MKITIDTTKDRPEDIRKAVAFLNSLSSTHSRVESRPRNIFEDPSPNLNINSYQDNPVQQANNQPTDSSMGNAFTNLFGNSESQEEKQELKPEEKEENQEQIEIVPY